jgi:hypothetical protein
MACSTHQISNRLSHFLKHEKIYGRLRPIIKIGLFLSLFLVATPALPAQVTWIPVPACGEDLTTLGDQLKVEEDPKYVLRAAAVGGTALIPILRTLSRPEEPDFTVSGAAQVAGLPGRRG